MSSSSSISSKSSSKLESTLKDDCDQDDKFNAVSSADMMSSGILLIPPDATAASGGKEVDVDEFVQTKTYLRRFWILAIFSFVSTFMCLTWNTWGPITQTALKVFDNWSEATIATYANWATISFVIFIVPMCYAAQILGLRLSALGCIGLILLATALRCITPDPAVFTIMCHLCAFINGVTGTLLLSLPPMIAAVWFPADERTTATAVGSLMNQMGSAMAYLEPLLVTQPSHNVTEIEREELRDEIMNLMYGYVGIAAVLFLAILAYFPAKPPLPPSISSSVERFDFMKGIKEIGRNPSMWIVGFGYGFSFGILAVWVGVLNLTLEPLGILQDESMWIGLTGVLASCIMAFVSSIITDHLYGHLKVTIIVLLCSSCSCFIWFFLLSLGYIPMSYTQVFISVVGGLSLQYASVPLFFELAVEIAYPTPEGVTGAFITGLFNLVSTIFLTLYLIPDDTGYKWVNYVLILCTALPVPPLFLLREKYERHNTDQAKAE
ncbi:solute carrier family 49 member 4 homolog [Oratosquilla oratoria]|uniref:solute carrier family 49 member 4 homolog n=1 Tax=Oratosquilla oratoria TaxID=337810 RepID=UPI003F76D2D6